MKQFFLSVLFIGLHTWASSQTPQLLGDIHKPTLSPFENLGGPFYSVHGKVLFFGLTYEQGYGLWTYDGSDRATYSSNQGSTSTNPAETNDGFYFISSYDVSKYWLFKHGGDPGVTIYLAEIKASSPNNIPSIASLNGKVLYPNWESTTGYELWIADDSPESAHLLKDATPGTGSTHPLELTKAVDLVYFRGGSTGRELWRTDGTEAGTFMVFQIVGTSQVIQPKSLKTLGNKAYFLVRNNFGETEFWTSDGTAAGTLKAADVPPATTLQVKFEAFFLDEQYIYVANDAQNEVFEWVAIDVNTAAPEILFDLTSTENYFLISNGNTSKSILNGEFYFIYINRTSQEYELWKSDGTALGTQKVVSLEGSATALASTKQAFFFFIKRQENIELWKSDGSIAGTTLTKDLGSNLASTNIMCAATDSTVFFRNPFSGPDSPDFPYRSDGTEQGTYTVMGAPASHLASSNPVGFISGPDEAVFFRADNAPYSKSVWRTEPSAPFSITLLDATTQDLYLETATPLTVGNKILWFVNTNTIHVTDASGLIDEIQLPVMLSSNGEYGPGGLVYFLANNNKSLWRTDGTQVGTFEVLAGPASSFLHELKAVGDSLYFFELITQPSQPFHPLWSSDGTSNGTQISEIIQSVTPNVYLQSIENRLAYSTLSDNPFARTLYVRGFDSVYFPDLKYDDFKGLAITDDQLFVLGPRIYSPTDSFHFSLWTAENGQPNLLRKFKSIEGEKYYEPRTQNRLHRLGNSVLFGAGLTENNVELWISDGTPSGTAEVRDLHPSGSSNPDNFVRYNDQLWLFTANDGSEVSWWATNGSSSGTFKIASLATVKDYFVPSISDAYLSGNRLFFSMNDGIVGQEPWIMVLEDSLVVSTLTPLTEANELSIWPNPAKDLVHLKAENQTGKPVLVKITNLNGQLVYQQKMMFPENGQLTIQLSQQRKGTHFIQIISETGKIWTKKLIIAE
jgi:ELWxxDGT repeat protein